MSETHKGSCLCGAARFEIDGPLESFYLCHCSRCRKSSGSAHGANLFSTKAALHWLSGEDQVQTYAVPGTRYQRCFCAHCGSMLPYTKGGKFLVLPAGSLDTPIEIRPTAHIHNASRADWDHDLDDVPGFEGLPE